MVTIRSDDFTRRDKVALKTADETVNNTTTLQADDALLVALGANETWILRYFIKFNSNTAGNFVLTWAQNTANASDTKVLIGSNIVAHRLA